MHRLTHAAAVLALALVTGCAGLNGGKVSVDPAAVGNVVGSSLACVSAVQAVANDAACRAAVLPAIASCQSAVKSGSALIDSK